MKVRYTRGARQQVAAIVDYIAAENPQGAQNVIRRLRRTIDNLLVFPNAGSPTSDPEIRRIVAVPYPYLIYYQVVGEEIVIHDVRDARRAPWSPRRH